eukprot:TRINITY_DN18643_c0_g1_i1.p1 TRINITY_DN18643_c0_g1~~TRINITY_DN18643_c0_g1_i1.p1  ORF type:complete len:207 (-),score=73.26 TRINITY_DN18643_c0_g1_i1:74-667(-)
MTDLERLQAKANAVTDGSLESTRRMMTMMEDSQATGAGTLDMLDSQGEQLNRVEGHLDNINAQMKEADKALTGMEKWCGLFVCPWNKAKTTMDADDAIWEKNEDGAVVKRQPGVKTDQRDAVGGPYVQRITNDSREDEMEENMAGVGNILGNLKNMATDMGAEIEKQNKQLDLIQGKTAGADVRIEQANKRTEKLLK